MLLQESLALRLVLVVLSAFTGILLTRGFFPKEKILPFLVGIVLIANPWLWVFTSLDTLLSFAAFLFGVFFLFQGKVKYFALVLFSLSWFVSDLFLLFIPLALLSLLVFDKRLKGILSLVFFVWVIFFAFNLADSSERGRLFAEYFSIGREIGYINNINVLRGQQIDYGMPIVGKALFNKAFFGVLALKNILSGFAPGFLFSKPIFVFYLPFLAIGLLASLGRRVTSTFVFLSFWLLFAAFPSAFLVDAPQADKLIVAFYSLSVYVAYGIYYVAGRGRDGA